MPARRMRQRREHKERFRQLIAEKVARRKESLRARVDDELPAWIAWALKPVASVMFNVLTASNNAKGEAGEDNVFFRLWLSLSSVWIVINDVVLEALPDEFIQLDHVLVGPPGVFLVETKAWDGAFLAHKDSWKRKQGGRWVHCDSPTQQSLRHRKLLAQWMGKRLGDGLPGSPEEWLYPNVVFTRAKWLRAEDCSVPVFESAAAFARHVREQTRRAVLPPEIVDRIAQALADAGPCEQAVDEDKAVTADALPETPHTKPAAPAGDPTKTGASRENAGTMAVRMEESKTKDGRAFVKVHGSRDEAMRIHTAYEEKGRQPTPYKPDRYAKGAWFFYVS